MSNEEIRSMCNDVFNIWWTKWRDKSPARKAEDWDKFVKEGEKLIEKYNRCPMVTRNVSELIGEMSERMQEEERIVRQRASKQ